MKYQTITNITAGAVLALSPLAVSASGFGGGWMIDKNSGTLYNANAPTVEQSARQPSDGYKNSFGGGWAHNKNSGTIYNTDMPAVQQDSYAATGKPAGGHKHSSDNAWAKNYMFSPS